MKIGICNDHAGVEYKNRLVEYLAGKGYEMVNFGTDTADSMVSQYLVYYKNNNGGIGRYSWVNDIELEDYEDYQARHIRRCKKCGAMENTDSLILERATQDGEYKNPIS